MKLRGRERVCFSTSARARVLPDRSESTEEITITSNSKTAQSLARAHNGPMLGRTRMDLTMQHFVEAIQSESSVKIESHAHNKLRWTGPKGDQVITNSTLPSETAFNELAAQLQSIDVLIPPRRIEGYEDGADALTSSLGIPITAGTAYLVTQMLDSLATDVKTAVAAAAKNDLSAIEQLVEETQEAISRDRRLWDAEKADLIRERDEARGRAEKAERALSTLRSALRGVDEALG